MLITLASGIVVFILVVLLFVFLILEAKKRLLPQGDVQLVINGEKTLTVKPGGTLLTALSEQGLLLAS
ncbi:MAG: NADH:ubiquinone reductase (Na(+)-transporting) subunit F, partial [Spirosomataceae bacterium]